MWRFWGGVSVDYSTLECTFEQEELLNPILKR